MADIVHVAKYLLSLTAESDKSINPLKLQKLLYYCEGWTLAITNRELFPKEQFQAWVHGPVNVRTYHAFNSSYGMYDPIEPEQAPLGASVTVEQQAIIERVFEVYNQYSGSELEQMTHSELPWIEARGTLDPDVPSTAVIKKRTMKKIFSQII